MKTIFFCFCAQSLIWTLAIFFTLYPELPYSDLNVELTPLLSFRVC